MAFVRGYANNYPHLMGRIGFGAGGPAQVKSINRRFQKLEDYIVKDSVANRDATLLAPVSKYNGVSSKTLVPITSGIKHVKLDFIFQNLDGRQYQALFSTGTTINYGWIAILLNTRLRFSSTVTNITLLENGVVIPSPYDAVMKPNVFYHIEFDVDLSQHTSAFIGTTRGGESLNGNIWDVEIDSMKIPLPHIGVGFDENGDPVKLTNTDVEEDYVKGGSKWLIQHGMMYDRDVYRKDALDPSNIGSWRNLDGGRAKIEDGYFKFGFYGVDNKPWFLNYLKEAIDSGNLASKGKLTTRVRVVKRSGDIRVYMALDGAKGIYKPPFKEDLDYLYFETPTDATYTHLAFGIYGTTGELWIDEIVSYWETVVPNKEDGSPAYDASGEFDQVINGTTFLNKTPFAIDFSGTNNSESELLKNGGFDADTDWLKGNSVIEDGVAKTLGGRDGYVAQNILTPNTVKYTSTFTIKKWGGSGNGAGLSASTVRPNILFRKIGTFTRSFVNNGASPTQFKLVATDVAEFDDVSVKEAPLEISFFDKSDTSIWKSMIRTGAHYDTDNTFVWHSSELTQQAIYENVQDAYKYHLWSKLINEFTLFKDIFFYNTALSDNVEICKTKTYVRVGEKDDLIEGSDVFCKTDIIMP